MKANEAGRGDLDKVERIKARQERRAKEKAAVVLQEAVDTENLMVSAAVHNGIRITVSKKGARGEAKPLEILRKAVLKTGEDY